MKGQHRSDPITQLSHWPRGTDLAPSSASIGTSISTERIPKSAARVLDAARIRAEFRQKRARSRIDDADANNDKSALKPPPPPPPPKKRRTNASAGDAEKSGEALTKGKDRPIGTIEIQPGESLKHFNRYAFHSHVPLLSALLREMREPFLMAARWFPLLFFDTQESRGPHASTGAIGNAYIGRDRAQGKESGGL